MSQFHASPAPERERWFRAYARQVLPGFLGVVLLLAATSPALAADRHVYLDTDGDGQLNDCPNPAHNAQESSNTDELFFCASAGSLNGLLVGTGAGRVSAAGCAADPGGAVTPVSSGSQVDADGDGTRESVYGHPQACVWNMARSDSCDVHAGVYSAPGASCDEDCGNQSPAGLEGTPGVCDKFDCFQASVVAFGDGPNLDGSGYGTAAAPGYLRAAEMNGVVDSWDPNGDKDPADGIHQAVLSGDANDNSAFDTTMCSGNTCTGDAFYGVIVGCGGSTYGRHFCRATPEQGTTYVRIDSDGDGSLDRDAGVFNVNSREVHHLRIKDLVFTRYNGGNGGLDGSRPKTATIDLNGGDGSTDGLVVEHIYLHDNDFTKGLDDVSADRVENEGYTENHWAAFNDQFNAGCSTPTVIQDSFLVQNNARLFNFDCGINISCGCETHIHDNRVVIDVDPTKVPTYVDPGGRVRSRSIAVGYYKNIDSNPAEHRLWNNEFIVKNMGNTRGYFMDLQGFGNAQGNGNGELWIYGNLFRHDPVVGNKMKRIWQGFCGIGTSGYRYYLLNNTFDMNVPMEAVCAASGALVVEQNNAFLRMTSLYAAGATTIRRTNNVQSTSSSNRAVWFDPGSYSVGNPGVHDGQTNYRPRAGGPLAGTGTCDPDGDGLAGFDADGDGSRDTAWQDLAGNMVTCPAVGSPLEIGALSQAGEVDTIPPADVQGLRRTDNEPAV